MLHWEDCQQRKDGERDNHLESEGIAKVRGAVSIEQVHWISIITYALMNNK